MPLAVMADGDFPAAALRPLEPGEILVLITNGVVEAHGPDDVLFGSARVLDIVRTHRGGTAREMVAALYGAVHEFCGVRTPLDDMTAIVVKAV